MELKDLKKTWDKLSSGNELDESQIKEMLGKHTKTLIERVDRNVKVGLVILFVLIFIFMLDDFFLSPLITEGLSDNLEIPKWLLFLGVFCDVLILTTFLFFVIRYYRVRKSCDVICNLKETLMKIIDTLMIYKRMFYLALVLISLTMAMSFISGMYQQALIDFHQQGLSTSEIQMNQWIPIAFIGLLVLGVTVGGIFLFLRWGFRRLYGNYIDKLKYTLKELKEIEE